MLDDPKLTITVAMLLTLVLVVVILALRERRRAIPYDPNSPEESKWWWGIK